MANIKYTGIFSYGGMFIINSGVADGHIVSGKLSHFSTKSNVFVCKWSVLHYNI